MQMVIDRYWLAMDEMKWALVKQSKGSGKNVERIKEMGFGMVDISLD